MKTLSEVILEISNANKSTTVKVTDAIEKAFSKATGLKVIATDPYIKDADSGYVRHQVTITSASKTDKMNYALVLVGYNMSDGVIKGSVSKLNPSVDGNPIKDISIKKLDDVISIIAKDLGLKRIKK